MTNPPLKGILKMNNLYIRSSRIATLILPFAAIAAGALTFLASRPVSGPDASPTDEPSMCRFTDVPEFVISEAPVRAPVRPTFRKANPPRPKCTPATWERKLRITGSAVLVNGCQEVRGQDTATIRANSRL